jgi:hypothetical protein
MGVHPWPGIDPASAYMTMTGGAWAAPMHAAGAALTALGGQVQSTVATSAVNDVIVGESWSGMGRVSAAASVSTLNTDQSTYSLLSELKAQLLNAAGELHTTTVPQMVTHVQANANRGEWGIDNAINPSVLGALTGRLIELDGEYFGFMWPNNASAGLRYGAGLDALGAALSGLSALPSVAGGSVAAPAMAAADVGANAGMSMMSAVMSATEQAATAAISPATSGASQAGSLVSQSPLSAPNTSSGMSGISPLANVTSQAPVSPSLPQSQPPAMGMFAPPAAAALTPSAPAMPSSPPVQAMTPSAAPGVTNFAKPAEPFNPPPPPSGGKAVGLKPGMLNATALRGPVGSAPTSNALLTKPFATSSLATQPLAYVAPDPSRPISSPPPSHPPLQDSGSVPTLNPPQAQQSPPQHTAPPQQPSTGDGPPPGPSTGSGGPQGSGGPGTQMPGSGQGGAPSAPLPAMPLDTRPPPIPPPPSPGEPPLRPPTPPSWAQPPKPPSVQAAQNQLNELEKLIQQHNSNPPDPSNYGAVSAYNNEADIYNAWAAQLEGQLDSSQVQYTPTTTANQAQIPSWTQPAPQQPHTRGPNLNQQAAQIGRDIDAENVPKGSRLNTLVDRLSQLHIGNQQQAAEAAQTGAEALWGQSGGIVNGPNGSQLVLPADLKFQQAIMVAPDGTLSIYNGDLYQFLPGR